MERCPICEGRGLLPCGFYHPYQNNTTTDISPVVCKICNGTGMIDNNPITTLSISGEQYTHHDLLREIVEKLNDIIKIINEENK